MSERVKTKAERPFKYATWVKRYKRNPQWPTRVNIVAVLWLDATKGESMQEAGAILALTPGVVMRVDDREIVLGHEVFEDGSERDVTTVPAGMVRRIVDLGHFDLP